MQLVERYTIQRNYPHHQEIDFLCLFAKTLYNYTQVHILHSCICQKKHLNFYFLNNRLKYFSNYQALPASAAQQVLLDLHCKWLKILAAIKTYKKYKYKYYQHYRYYKFFGRLKLRQHQHTETDRNLLVYMADAMSKLKIKAALSYWSQTNIFGISTLSDYSRLYQTRSIPKIDHYMVKIVYKKQELEQDLTENSMTAIDLARGKLASANYDQPGFIPVIVKEQMIKSTNRYYHQQKAKLKSLLPTYQTISKQLKTIKTKLYRADHSLLINTDFNGSLNILIFRKLFPTAFSLGV